MRPMDRLFENLYQEYLNHYPAAGWVGEAIGQAIAELNLHQRVRWDARHFLLVNTHQMIVLPIEQGEMPVENLEGLVNLDLRAVLSKAAEGSQEISSYAVLDATAEIYGSLLCGDLWNPL